MKVFILEDDQNRVEWFLENLETEDIDLTEKAQEGIDWLRERKYDVIFLDHDLGGRVYVSSDEFNTGYTVAKMIHETDNVDTPVIIHSWNSNGAKNMKDALTSNGVVNQYHPFMSLEFKMVVNNVNQQGKPE